MRQKKAMFMWHIIVFNFIRLFPYSSEYFRKYFLLTEQDSAEGNVEQCSRYMQIVNAGQVQFGWIGVLYANVALMLFSLPLCIAADYFIANTHEFVIRTIISLLCFLLMIEKFDILRLHDKPNFLKLLYAGYSLFSASYWSIAYLFLAVFENCILGGNR